MAAGKHSEFAATHRAGIDVDGEHPMKALHRAHWRPGFVAVDPGGGAPCHDALAVFEVGCKRSIKGVRFIGKLADLNRPLRVVRGTSLKDILRAAFGQKRTFNRNNRYLAEWEDTWCRRRNNTHSSPQEADAESRHIPYSHTKTETHLWAFPLVRSDRSLGRLLSRTYRSLRCFRFRGCLPPDS